MNGYKKEEVRRDMCKSHSARSDRELYRVCPSKLSKKELEDLYFTLLDKNLELKKTVTGQQDQIKVLSTKVQRMTATQKNNVAREKDCCIYTKGMVNEQKESIADLKRANERLSERIRVLNMRLCSAKQFLRRSPATSTSRCTKCSAPPMSLKNSSVSVLHAKMSDTNVKTAVSSQGLDKDAMLSTRTVETETEEPEKENPDRICNENRCRSLMEELKQKIVDLQEELSKTHSEYSSRISRLESEVSEVRSANERERSQRAADEQQLQLRGQRADQLAARLRDAEAKYGELSTELSVEKRKVAELETRVKAADRASAVSKTIQEHFNTSDQMKNEIDKPQSEPTGSPEFTPRLEKLPFRLEVPCETLFQPAEATNKTCIDKDDLIEKSQHERLSKLSTDSGYIEAYKSPNFKDEKKTNDPNEDLKNRLACLQQQINQLLVAVKSTNNEINEPTAIKGILDGYEDSRLVIPVTNQVNEIPVCEPPIGRTMETSQDLQAASGIKVKPKPDDLMTFLDNATIAEDAEVVNANPPDATGPNTTANSEKKGINEAPNVNLVTDTAKRDSSDDKVIPTCADMTDKSKTQAIKDSHNKFQIPGPLPVDDVYKVNNRIFEKFKMKRNNVKCKRQNNELELKGIEMDKPISSDVKKNEDVENPLRIQNDDNEKNMDLKSPTHNNLNFERDIKVGIKSERDSDSSRAKTPMPIGSVLMEKYIHTDEAEKIAMSSMIIPTISSQNEEDEIIDQTRQNSHESLLTPHMELCLQHTRVCTCGDAKRRDVSVFRTCSGTLRFLTTPSTTGPTFKQCGCIRESFASNDVTAPCSQGIQTGTKPPAPTEEFRQRSATYTKGQAYPTSLHSPENTDCEISSLTDLPSEKDDKSPRDALSPGEEKCTTTFTESCSPHTTTEYSTLSEGELPGPGGAQKLSDGETKVDDNGKKQPYVCMRTSARMEEALAAITEELALCRGLLHARRASESKSLTNDASQTTTDLSPEPMALKKTPGSPRIGNAITPKCIFTLHIGTVVLSDEAVINSRDLSLVLTWKFYDQNTTMTRLWPGRVVLYDFSTEYDIKITDHFLNYLKYENMHLILCEVESQNEPFASCALPLRDALLHTNRRADMSLALVAGPNLRQTHDALDTGDEVGVLDLWCMLRVDAALLPAINRAIARPSPPNPLPKTNIGPLASTSMAQLMEDDRYNDDHISQDLDIGPSVKPIRNLYDIELPKTPHVKSKTELYEYESRPGRHRSASRKQSESPNLPPISELRYSEASQYSSPIPTQPTHRSSVRSLQQRSQVFFKDADSIHSRIIVNEVPAKIKTATDLTEALERDAVHVPPISRLRKTEEDTASQTQIPSSYWKSLVSKRHNQKSAKRSSLTKKESSTASLHKKDHTNMVPKGVQAIQTLTDIEEPPELTKTNRTQNNSKKSVTIAKTTSDSNTRSWDRESKTFQELPNNEMLINEDQLAQTVEITVMWLALNEECDAMNNPHVQRLYVAYTFLGRSGADMETPVSLPKPKNYVDKCYFHFTKRFHLSDCDLPLLGHMARCRLKNRTQHSSKDCAIFTVISEPPEDPLGLDSCEDIGHAYLYFGDVLAYSAGNNSYVDVVPVQSTQPGETVCGVLAVKVDGLDVMRRCTLLATSQRDLGFTNY